MRYSLKLIPRRAPNAEGQWIEVVVPEPLPDRFAEACVALYGKHVSEEDWAIVQVKWNNNRDWFDAAQARNPYAFLAMTTDRLRPQDVPDHVGHHRSCPDGEGRRVWAFRERRGLAWLWAAHADKVVP